MARQHDALITGKTDTPANITDSGLITAGGNCGSDLMTEEELIVFLRIDEVSTAKKLHHVVENLKRMRGLPCIYICNKPLYPRAAVLDWIAKQTEVRP